MTKKQRDAIYENLFREVSLGFLNCLIFHESDHG